MCCLQPDGDVKLGHRRPAGAGRRDEDRRERRGACVAAPACSSGYYKHPEATAERPGRRTAGSIPAMPACSPTSGHLRIIDRAKDVGTLNDGTLFAPKYLENKLKFFPYIKEAVAFGDGRDFAARFINIDLDAVGNWAERRGIAYTGYTDLAGRAEVYELIAGCIEQVNRRPGGRRCAGRLADPPLPDPAQGARRRRRRADPHAQGAPRLHRREVCAC